MEERLRCQIWRGQGTSNRMEHIWYFYRCQMSLHYICFEIFFRICFSLLYSKKYFVNIIYFVILSFCIFDLIEIYIFPRTVMLSYCWISRTLFLLAQTSTCLVIFSFILKRLGSQLVLILRRYFNFKICVSSKKRHLF